MTLRSFQCQLAPHGRAVDDAGIATAVQAIAQLRASLVLVLGDARHFQEAANANLDAASTPLGGLLRRLSQEAPQAAVIGCSTAGEILGDTVLQGTLTVTAVALEHTRVHACTLPLDRMEDSNAVGRSMSLALRQECGPDLQQVWVLAPGVNINGSALVQGMSGGFEGTTPPGISGGLAADGGAFQRTWTLGPAGISDHHVVALGFSGAQVISGSSAQGGWETFGPARRVTRAQGNRLFEMDREPALDVYRRYLGEYAKDLPASGLLFPLQITQGPDSGLIRTILGIDEAQGGLVLAGDVATDSYVRLMHASTHHLVAAAEQAAQRMRPGLIEGCPSMALLVSCVGRRIVMGDQTEEEVEAVREALPPNTLIAGFYSNGEIAAWNYAGDCRLHNQTMTISWLAEGPGGPPS